MTQESIKDNGYEFLGYNFQELLNSYGVKGQPKPVKNLQVNALIKILHDPLGDQLCSITFAGENETDDLNNIIQACAYSVQATMLWNFLYSPA